MSLPEEKGNKPNTVMEELVWLVIQAASRTRGVENNAGNARKRWTWMGRKMNLPPTDVGGEDLGRLGTLRRDGCPELPTGLPKEGGDFAGVTSKGSISPSQTNESGEGMKKFPPDLERHVGGGPVGRGPHA